MTKIGVISDTHLTKPNQLLEEVAKVYFKDVDLVLHCGDLITLNVLNAFNGKRVIAVAGNNDRSEVRRTLHHREIVSVNQFKIGLLHGWGWPIGLEKRIDNHLKGIQCLVYGHSHWPANHPRNGILFFNPGSFSGGPFSLWRRTIGLLTVDKDIRGEIIRI